MQKPRALIVFGLAVVVLLAALAHWLNSPSGDATIARDGTARHAQVQRDDVVPVESPSVPSPDRMVQVSGSPAVVSTSGAPDAEPAPLEPGGLIVQVLDHTGAPLGGVYVCLAVKSFGQLNNLPKIEVTRAHDGCARLGVEDFVGDRVREIYESTGATVHARALVASVAPVSTEIVGMPEANGRVIITVPPMGSVKVKVLSADGEPFEQRSGLSAVLRVPGGDHPNGRPERTGAGIEDGFALLEHIEVGQELLLQAGGQAHSRTATDWFPGPALAGEVIETTLVMGEAYAYARVRPLDRNGEPMRLVRFDVSRSDPATGPFTRGPVPTERVDYTDEDGSLKLLVSGRYDEGVALEIIGPAGGDDMATGRALAGAFDIPADIVAGEERDLGDVRMRPATHAVSGWVQDKAGDPIEGATVAVKAPENAHRPQPFAGSKSDAAGRFRIGVWSADDVYLVTASHDGYIAVEADAVSAGANDVIVRMQKKKPRDTKALGEIAYSVLHDPGIIAFRFDLHFKHIEADRAWQARMFVAGEDTLSGLTAGTYSVRVVERDSGFEAARFDNINVTGGEVTRDARLLPIDLRDVARAVMLKLRSADGLGPLSGEVFVSVPGSDIPTFRAQLANDGLLYLALPRAASTLVLKRSVNGIETTVALEDSSTEAQRVTVR